MLIPTDCDPASRVEGIWFLCVQQHCQIVGLEHRHAVCWQLKSPANMQRALIDGGVVVYRFVDGALCTLKLLVLYNLTTCHLVYGSGRD